MPKATVAPRRLTTELLFQQLGDGRLASLSLLQAYRLDASATDGPATSWIQVALVGDFVSPVYGEFAITKKDLRQMFDNFTNGVHPVPPTRLCMDYDHLSEQPDAPGDGKAAGWFAELELRANARELWARIEWTEDGADAIRKKEYQFVSPSFHPAFTTPAGERAGCTLLASAITNRPFLQGMDPLSLSATFGGVSMSKGDLAHFRRLEVLQRGRHALADFSFDDQRARIYEALEERFGSEYTCGCNWYLCDVFDAFVLYRYDGHLYQLAYALDATTGVVTFSGDPIEVVLQPTPLALNAGHGGRDMTGTIKLRDAQGKEFEIKAEALEELPLVKELRAKIPTGEVVALTDHQKVVADVVTLTGQVKELTDAGKKRDATDEVDTLILAGKILPAQKDVYVKLALNNGDNFKELTATLPVISPVKPPMEQGSGGEGNPSGETAVAEVQRLAAVEQGKDAKLSTADAVSRILSTNAPLYRRYTAETAIKV